MRRAQTARNEEIVRLFHEGWKLAALSVRFRVSKARIGQILDSVHKRRVTEHHNRQVRLMQTFDALAPDMYPDPKIPLILGETTARLLQLAAMEGHKRFTRDAA